MQGPPFKLAVLQAAIDTARATGTSHELELMRSVLHEARTQVIEELANERCSIALDHSGVSDMICLLGRRLLSADLATASSLTSVDGFFHYVDVSKCSHNAHITMYCSHTPTVD
jgi:hypothetical protein